MNKLFLAFIILSSLSCSRQLPHRTFQLPPTLDEVSGLYIDDANRFWWHNDSGNAPELYQTDGSGKVIKIVPFQELINRDWEDLSYDNKGNVYIGDFGNNRNRRQDLRIYRYDTLSGQIDSLLFKYPDQLDFPPSPSQANFDAEAFFWYKDTLHLFSKNRLLTGDYKTKHYSLSDAFGAEQIAILKDEIFLKKRVVTAAAISPDGQTVALLAYFYKKLWGFIPYSSASIFLIKNYEGTNFLDGEVYKKRMPWALLAKQFEALDFLNEETIYVASERTLFFKPKAKKLKLRARDYRKKKRVEE